MKDTMDPVDYSKFVEMYCEIEANFLVVWDFECITPTLVASFHPLAFSYFILGFGIWSRVKAKDSHYLFVSFKTFCI